MNCIYFLPCVQSEYNWVLWQRKTIYDHAFWCIPTRKCLLKVPNLYVFWRDPDDSSIFHGIAWDYGKIVYWIWWIILEQSDSICFLLVFHWFILEILNYFWKDACFFLRPFGWFGVSLQDCQSLIFKENGTFVIKNSTKEIPIVLILKYNL